MRVRQVPRSAARPRLVQGDPAWRLALQGDPDAPSRTEGGRKREDRNTNLLVTKEIQSSRQTAVVLVVMGLNKIASSYYSHKQAAFHQKAYRSLEVPILFPLKFHEKRLVFLAKQNGN